MRPLESVVSEMKTLDSLKTQNVKPHNYPQLAERSNCYVSAVAVPLKQLGCQIKYLGDGDKENGSTKVIIRSTNEREWRIGLVVEVGDQEATTTALAT